MTTPLLLKFSGPPHMGLYMMRAIIPKKKLATLHEAPPIRAICEKWVPAQIAPWQFDKNVHPIHLHASTVRLNMTILTHEKFPVPIWNVLQIRNKIIVHKNCCPTEELSVEAEWVGSRVLAKGVEFDIKVLVSNKNGPVIESLNTFYNRGNKGWRLSPDYSPVASPLAPENVVATWALAQKGAGKYCRTTGDYNGVHYMRPYARALGFHSPFSHPHRALAQIVDRILNADVSSKFEISAWFKGPVYYDKDLRLSVDKNDGDVIFALRVQDDARPAIIGNLKPISHDKTNKKEEIKP